MNNFHFQIDATSGNARAGIFSTPHGQVETPAFMPVGTHGAVRGLSVNDMRNAGAKMVLANAYHLALRPGDEIVKELGGLHEFTSWKAPMLTDSGGFQVFSLARLRTVNEDGVSFRSHIDGSPHFFSPESVMKIEKNLGADVIMQFDQLIAAGSGEIETRKAMERSLRWLSRCKTEFDKLSEEENNKSPQALFPIVQGGIFQDLRTQSVRGILDRGDWPGVAVGGLSVGEAKPDMHEVLETCSPLLPANVPHYLMGVGFPDDLVEGVRRGMDLFDCVAPNRMGRDGTAFTPDGKVQIRQSAFRTDPRALVDGCNCEGCTHYSRAFIRHMFSAGDALGPRLLALHNVSFLIDLMRQAREAIKENRLESWSDDWLKRWHTGARN